MANPKSSDTGEELSPEQQKFAEIKQQQATEVVHRSDRGQYLKSGRQQKEEEKAVKKAELPPAKPVTRREFLNYAWGAALAVVLVEAGAASFFFAMPRSIIASATELKTPLIIWHGEEDLLAPAADILEYLSDKAEEVWIAPGIGHFLTLKYWPAVLRKMAAD
jgi:pimeloyl-ACP methyl ester carboxylesterase